MKEKISENKIDLLEKYLNDPCGTLSIPYWKYCRIHLPSNIKIIHCKDFNGQFNKYERYFRIIHHLQEIKQPQCNIETINIDKDIDEIVEMINISYQYDNISISSNDIELWKNTSTYNPNLFVKIVEKGKIIASGIGTYDPLCQEGSIEWVQVLPEYRRAGLGKIIVECMLYRFKKFKAKFVTVSGKIESQYKQEMLYRKCGFVGNDIWYICNI